MIATLYMRGRERLRGQTMTDYVVALAAIAVAALVAYRSFGTDMSQTAVDLASYVQALVQ